MFGKKIKLFTLLGFKVSIDPSWIILGILITWTLARGVFPHYYPSFSASTYWLMGVAGALGLFVSIVFHEFSHSIVARRYGLPIEGITLFIFGGVAEMAEEPSSARAEFMMAVAGPAASIVLGLLSFAVGIVAAKQGWPEPASGVISYLATINLVLAGFNMLPAFPLDGGRVLRSALWGWKKNIRWATYVASRIGAGFGIGLIILGLYNVIVGELLGGIWWFLIGMYLRSASHMSYRQTIMRNVLEGEKVRRFMNPDPVTVPPRVTIEEFIEHYVYRHHFKMFPVVDEDRLMGCIDLEQVKKLTPRERSERTVGEIARSCSDKNSIGPDEDVMKALSMMRRGNASRLMVVQDGTLAGIITLKDLLSFLSLKIDLER